MKLSVCLGREPSLGIASRSLRAKPKEASASRFSRSPENTSNDIFLKVVCARLSIPKGAEYALSLQT